MCPVSPKPERKGILELLDPGSHLKTPAFQRSFAWERSQVHDFWTDLQRALDTSSGPADYFLGLLVVDSSDQIQDGQQRLATTLLMASEMHRLVQDAKIAGTHDPQLAIDVEAQITPALRQNPGRRSRSAHRTRPSCCSVPESDRTRPSRTDGLRLPAPPSVSTCRAISPAGAPRTHGSRG